MEVVIKEKKGNIFTTECEVIVNAINCVGVMGAGIALEFKLRHPDMFEKYKQFCEEKKIDIGVLWIFTPINSGINYKRILNFPTKKHWKYPSKIEYIEKGLDKFVATYKDKKITSIAFPMLGTAKGGLSSNTINKLLKEKLSKCENLTVEIWEFDPHAKDDLYETFKEKFFELDFSKLKIRKNILEKIELALKNDNINSFNGLLRVKGIGFSSIEKLLDETRKLKENNQQTLSF